MMVTRWGLSEKLGTVAYGENQDEVFLGYQVSRQQNISEATSQTIDAEVRRLVEAGYADGLFSVVQGNVSTVEALVDHPGIEAVGFVGSSGAAHSVYARATALGKRALCLGGAKNQLLVAPDADADLTVKAVVDSFTGCAGQRCMAMSVLVVVGDAARLIEPIVERAGRIRLGSEMGALIDSAAHARLTRGIARALAQGATLRLDGREQSPPAGCEGGNWLGPTVLDQVTPAMDCAHDELFGPVLSIVRFDTLDEALALERASRYGNATSIFTRSGAVARYVAERATSGMVGVNVGVPVPRDPFSFGGRKDSKFGPGDLTGPGGIEFWSNLKKITTKWALAEDNNWMS
jgi:malonate-semialdehyde dehydrogenase (acetylating)/methylmalonate-semialdehyde dehydrogenase